MGPHRWGGLGRDRSRGEGRQAHLLGRQRARGRKRERMREGVRPGQAAPGQLFPCQRERLKLAREARSSFLRLPRLPGARAAAVRRAALHPQPRGAAGAGEPAQVRSRGWGCGAVRCNPMNTPRNAKPPRPCFLLLKSRNPSPAQPSTFCAISNLMSERNLPDCFSAVSRAPTGLLSNGLSTLSPSPPPHPEEAPVPSTGLGLAAAGWTCTSAQSPGRSPWLLSSPPRHSP